MSKLFQLLLLVCFCNSVFGQGHSSDRIKVYLSGNKENSTPSTSTGTVSGGTLINGKLFPFQGTNYQYFDTSSYINNRAFLNDKIRTVVISSYEQLEKEIPNRKFFIMECSNKNGGEIFPHRTHQNGLSIDFMMPLMKDNMVFYKLDTIGASHYWLDFDNEGKYSGDKSISIDFDLVARQILSLETSARNNGYKIQKVIIKTEFKNLIFATPHGKKLKQSNIYLVNSLTPLINSLHDDHFHIDFEILK
ncbi:penicillin-insensitive murein endopeptidase [Sporocytophaga myxococcoides]|uniref:penicillin-insensitive murein endopeptidase n=1 Tax=Sporocytophaga myxococcoides TaxID=153721 RepID=UPI00040EBF18|nr:penicillin-insensitive murein endopeptidase [Sporocytophaga myxococcoides]